MGRSPALIHPELAKRRPQSERPSSSPLARPADSSNSSVLRNPQELSALSGEALRGQAEPLLSPAARPGSLAGDRPKVDGVRFASRLLGGCVGEGEEARGFRGDSRQHAADQSTRDEGRASNAKPFPYYDTESDDEGQRRRSAEKRREEEDWLEEQRKSLSAQQRRFQALIDKLRLQEGDLHVAPSVRNNVLSKLQEALPSPASLVFPSPSSSLSASSPSSSSSYPASPSAAQAAAGEEGDASPEASAWTQATALVRRLQQMHAQREELERWEEEQRRLQREQARELREKQREQEKKDWEAQMARQIATNKAVQRELDERLRRSDDAEDASAAPAATPQQQIKKLLTERPPDTLIDMVKAAQAKGDEVFPVASADGEKTQPSRKGENKKGKAGPTPMPPRPGLTLHVQSLQVCWSKREGGGRPRRRSGRRDGAADSGQDDSDASFSSSSSFFSSSEDDRGGARAKGKGRAATRRSSKKEKSRGSKRNLTPPRGLPLGTVSYCIVAKYAEKYEGTCEDLPVFTTAWYEATVAFTQTRQKTADEQDPRDGRHSQGDDAAGNRGDPALGRRAKLAAAYLGKSLSQQAGAAKAESAAAPVQTLIKEACILDTDITLPQLAPVQAARVDPNCLLLQLWRYEKQIRRKSKSAATQRRKKSSLGSKAAARRGRSSEKARREPGRDEETDEPSQYLHHIEEVGRIYVDLEDARVYDRSQSVFPITPVPVDSAFAQESRGPDGAATPGLSGGRRRSSKYLSLAATAVASSGTLYAFITSTVRKVEPLQSVLEREETEDRPRKAWKAPEVDAGESPTDEKKEMLQWKYVDDFKVLQGPFSSRQMVDWIRAGYFEEDAPVCPADEANRLQPLRVVLGKIRRDAEEFRRLQKLTSARRQASKSDEAPLSVSSKDSSTGSGSEAAEDAKEKQDEDKKAETDGKKRRTAKALETPGTSNRPGGGATITLTTTADSAAAVSPASSHRSRGSAKAAPRPKAKTEKEQVPAEAEPKQPGRLMREKGAEVQNVMKLLEEATHCLSRISTHRMSNYLRCTVADPGRSLPASEPPPAAMEPSAACFQASPLPAVEGRVLQPGQGPASCEGPLEPNAVEPAYLAGQTRRAQIRERMRALEQMFGRAALREACAVYIQAAVRGWLQRLRLWRTYQAEVAAMHLATAGWNSPHAVPYTGFPAYNPSSRFAPNLLQSPSGQEGNDTLYPGYPAHVGDRADFASPGLPAGVHYRPDFCPRDFSLARATDGCGGAVPSVGPFSRGATAGGRADMSVHASEGWGRGPGGPYVGGGLGPVEPGSSAGGWGAAPCAVETFGAFGRDTAGSGRLGWEQGVSSPSQGTCPSFLSYTQIAAERGLAPALGDSFPHR